MKQIAKSAEIVSRLKAAFGPDADIEDLAVFETIALNQIPIRKKGHPLMEGAVAQMSLLQGVVGAVNTESQPLQLMHNGYELPSGRVFDARMHGGEVRALFAISQKTDADLIAKIDSGIIDQVSVNVLAKQILCSKCNWDFRGPGATFENVYTATCANDHELRVDGVYAKLEGLEWMSELSLVNKGGAVGAKIVGQSQSVYSAEPFQRLAASGHVPQLLLASISPTLDEEPEVNAAEFTAQLTAAVTAKTTAETNLVAAQTHVTELTSQVTTLTGERDAAQAQVTELTTAVTELTDKAGKVDKAVTALKTEATTILTACGKAGEVANLTDDVDALLSVINEHRAQFAAAIPVNGKSNAPDKPAGQVQPTTAGAFRSPRR